MGGIKKLNSYLPQYKSTFLSLGNIFFFFFPPKMFINTESALLGVFNSLFFFFSLGNIFKGKYIIKKYSGQAR